MAQVALFVLLGSGARALKDVALAYHYGTGPLVDAYLLLFNLITSVTGIWLSILSIILVPMISRIRHDEPGDLRRFQSELLGLTLLLGLTIALLIWQGLPALLQSGQIGLPQEAIDHMTSMLPALSWLAPLGLVIGLYSSLMLADRRHANTLLESIPSLAILAALLAFPGGFAAPLVWGTLVGFISHAICLAICTRSRNGFIYPHVTQRSAQWKYFWRGFWVMLAGQSLIGSASMIDQFFAATLETGSIATLNYATKVLALALGIGALAISRATLPVFSQIHATQGAQLHEVAMHWVKLAFACGVLAALCAQPIAPWGIRLLFERGAFSPSDTQAVTEVFRYSLIQLPLFLSGTVLVSLLSSQGRYRAIAAIAITSLIVKVATMMTLTPSLGLNGIALSTAAMYAVSLTLLTRSVRGGRVEQF